MGEMVTLDNTGNSQKDTQTGNGSGTEQKPEEKTRGSVPGSTQNGVRPDSGNEKQGDASSGNKGKKRPHKVWRCVRRILIAVLSLILVVALAFAVSPIPSVLIFRNAFKDGNPVKPAELAEAKTKVSVEKDISYPSQYKKNTFDLYTPKASEAGRKLPVIVWVHGGGFIAGDKAGLATYGTLMAAQGYAVVSMNYAYAPGGRYPAPVVQVGELLSYLNSSEQADSLDMSKLVIGGDSAGAQIAAQFAAVETTPGYAELTGIRKVVLPHPIAGMLLFCGPYDMKSFANAKTSWVESWFMNTLSWAYLGHRDWKDSKEIKQASIVDYVSKDFPPSYIVDGNYFSFPDQGRELVSRLQQDGVQVTSSFFPDNKSLPHEFQFDFVHPESELVWSKTRDFLGSIFRD